MKPPSEEHDLIRWLDGEMDETERAAFEARIKANPALAQEAEEMRALSAGIRAHLPAEMAVPHADFFNSQIQVRIGQMEIDEARRREAVAPVLGSLLSWLRQSWLTAAGAVAVAVVAFLSLRPSSEDAHSLILSSYTPSAGVQTVTFHDDNADATVLMLDGLEEVPADRKISGISISRSETEPEMASTTLFDAAGSPQLVIFRDAAGNPQFWASKPRG